jgi:hypothetical protein
MQEETISILYQKNAEMLEQENNLHIKGIAKSTETDYEMPCTTGKSGRRSLALKESSERRKHRKSKELRKMVGFPDITHATKMSLRSAGTTGATKTSLRSAGTTGATKTFRK